MFEPIAIVGQSCVLPDALTPQQLWENIYSKKNDLSFCDKNLFPQKIHISEKAFCPDANKMQGGFIKGFYEIFNPSGFSIPAEEILKLDRIFHWLLYMLKNAAEDVKISIEELSNKKCGLILGNLFYPTKKLNDFSYNIWLQQNAHMFNEHQLQKLTDNFPHPLNRFSSGFPAQLAAKAANITGSVFTIDAACASSLYAIKLACDELHTRKADVMLTGGINAVDNLFIYVGFSALKALSQCGRSLPFHSEATGLLPGEGGGIIVLKRLADAVQAKDKIYGVIRGIGLSNDGKQGGFLTPAISGQIVAMQKAYQQAQLNPNQIDFVDCHAVGTPVGDETEIQSMKMIFNDPHKLPIIAALKSNLGHLLAASGIAAVIRTLAAINQKTFPATLTADNPAEFVKNSPFKLLAENQSWNNAQQPRRAAVSCFGFGGNNAHLIIEEYQPSNPYFSVKKHVDSDPIAIVGISVICAGCKDVNDFKKALVEQKTFIKNQNDLRGGFADDISFSADELSASPKDLEKALPQHLYLLKSCQQAISQTKLTTNTSVFAGMQCSPEIARYFLRWKLPEILASYEIQTPNDQWLDEAQNAICTALDAATVIGNNPSLVANRVNKKFNFTAPSFSIGGEQMSGIHGLTTAQQALKNFEIDAAVVSAVDLCCEPVQQTAGRRTLSVLHQIPGDAAVTVILKRLSDARRDQDHIYATLTEQTPKQIHFKLGDGEGAKTLCQQFGHSHATCGLLHIAAGALYCQQKPYSCAEIKVSDTLGKYNCTYLQFYGGYS